MRHLYSFITRHSLNNARIPAFCLAALFIFASIAQAQSGRRVKRPPISPSPAPEAQTQPTPTVKVSKAPQFSLYVGMDQRDLFANIPLYFYDSIRTAFVQRLNQASSINITTGGEMHRGEAVKRAKNEQSTYVVLLQLDLDAFDPRSSTGSNVDSSRLSIRYAVFAPVTGKTKMEGRVYQQQYRTGRGRIGLPSPGRNNPIYSEYLLKEAAREAADRVLEEFNIYTAPRGPRLDAR
jgi:hypothetical protein